MRACAGCLHAGLDALIAEKDNKAKSAPKGVRVKPTSSFAKKKVAAALGRTSGGGGNGGGTRGGDATVRGMGVSGRKISKTSGGQGRARTITAMEDENGGLVPVMMVPAARLGGRMGGRMGGNGGGMGSGPRSMGDDGLPPPVNHMRKDPDAAGKWTHDLFDAREQGAARSRAMYASHQGGGAPSSGSRLKTEMGTSLRVSNIHPKVTPQDLEELFSEVGQMISADFDYEGRWAKVWGRWGGQRLRALKTCGSGCV